MKALSVNKNSDRWLIIIICIMAAARVFIYSVAFPFFNNIDEWAHFDMVMKYSKGHIPRSLEIMDPTSLSYFGKYDSPEFVTRTDSFPGNKYPDPVWKNPNDVSKSFSEKNINALRDYPNPESTQPPLYYMVAGLWTRMGELFGLCGAWLLYWIRFLNVILIAAVVWLAYMAAKKLFPGERFMILGVPLLAAFLPQDTFYAIESDVLSPVCFGLAFIALIDFMKEEIPTPRQGILAGLAVAACVIVKMSNLVLLAVVILILLYKIYSLIRSKKFSFASHSVGWFLFFMLVPVFIWMAWNFNNSGDVTGSESKIQLMDWTHKSLLHGFSHPIFTLKGIKIFWSLLMISFWKGEYLWAGSPMKIHAVDVFYWVSSILLLIWSVIRFRKIKDPFRRKMTWVAFLFFISLVLYLAVLSLSFDFGNCPYPSKGWPYFVSGRLMDAGIIPFALLYIYGIYQAVSWIRNIKLQLGIMMIFILFIFITELIIRWPAFSSQYNFFHL